MRNQLTKLAGAAVAAGALFAYIPAYAQQQPSQGSGAPGANGQTYSEQGDDGRSWGWLGLLGLIGLAGLKGRQHHDDARYRRDMPRGA